ADIKTALSSLKKPPLTPKPQPLLTQRDLLFLELKQRVANRTQSPSSKPRNTSAASRNNTKITGAASSSSTETTTYSCVAEETETFGLNCDSPKVHESSCKTVVVAELYSEKECDSMIKTVTPLWQQRPQPPPPPPPPVLMQCPNKRLDSLERDFVRVKRKFEEMISSHDEDEEDDGEGGKVVVDGGSGESGESGVLAESLIQVRSFKRRRRTLHQKEVKPAQSRWSSEVSAVAVAAIGPVVGFAVGFFMALGHSGGL
ncbi:hypothetical protein BDR26DRAFT_854656, partial [Obelidium mucronatum]